MIAAPLLAEVAAEVERLADSFSVMGDTLVTHLRGRFPGVHFSVCNDDDTPPRLSAAAGSPLFNLYYIDSSEHCLKLTNDAEAATGLVVAIRDQDE